MLRFSKLFFFIAILGVVFFAAPYMQGEQGYVLFAIGNWTLEGSLVSFILTITMMVTVLYGIYLLIKYAFVLLILPSKWWQQKVSKAQSNHFQSGINLMALAQWQAAIDQFLKVKRSERIETAKQLSLVCAAQQQSINNTEVAYEVEELIKLPQLSDSSGFAKSVEISFAQLLLLCQQQHYQQADTLLAKAQEPVLKQDWAFQRLWLEVKINTGDWEAVDRLFIKIYRQQSKLCSDLSLQEWQTNLINDFALNFHKVVRESSLSDLESIWGSLAAATRKHQVLEEGYLKALAQLSQAEKIQAILLKLSGVASYPKILQQLRLYLEFNSSLKMPELATKIQKLAYKQKDNKTLIHIMAYLAYGEGDYALSKQAFHTVLQQTQDKAGGAGVINQPATNIDKKLYANALVQLGESEKAIKIYQTLAL